MTSILDANTVVSFLIKHPNVSMNQFLFCILHLYDEEYKKRNGLTKIERPLSKMYAYIDARSYKEGKSIIKPFNKDEIESLIDQGFMEKLGNRFSIDMLRVTKKFKRELYGESYEFKEFVDAYPTYIPNFNHPARPDINLKSTNLELLEREYLKKIKTEKAHERVIELVSWARDNNLINTTIENFVKGEMWEHIEEQKHKSSDLGVDL